MSLHHRLNDVEGAELGGAIQRAEETVQRRVNAILIVEDDAADYEEEAQPHQRREVDVDARHGWTDFLDADEEDVVGERMYGADDQFDDDGDDAARRDCELPVVEGMVTHVQPGVDDVVPDDGGEQDDRRRRNAGGQQPLYRRFDDVERRRRRGIVSSSVRRIGRRRYFDAVDTAAAAVAVATVETKFCVGDHQSDADKSDEEA